MTEGSCMHLAKQPPSNLREAPFYPLHVHGREEAECIATDGVAAIVGKYAICTCYDDNGRVCGYIHYILKDKFIDLRIIFKNLSRNSLHVLFYE